MSKCRVDGEDPRHETDGGFAGVDGCPDCGRACPPKPTEPARVVRSVGPDGVFREYIRRDLVDELLAALRDDMTASLARQRECRVRTLAAMAGVLGADRSEPCPP